MAWASKKQYAIMMSSEEGKNLVERMPEMEQDEFQVEFGKLLGKEGGSITKEPEEDTKYHFQIGSKERTDTRKMFKHVFRKADEEYFNEFFGRIEQLDESEKALFFKALYEGLSGGVWQQKGEGCFKSFERKILLDRADLIDGTGIYEKYGVAFHEFGHAIDYNIGDGIRRGSYASYTFVGKNGLTMHDQLIEEYNSLDWNEIKKDISKDLEKANKRIDELREVATPIENEFNSLREDNIKLLEELFASKNNEMSIVEWQRNQDFITFDRKDENNLLYHLWRELKWKSIWNYEEYSENLVGDLKTYLGEDFSKLVELKNKHKGLTRKITSYRNKVKRDWGDVSDIYSGFSKNADGYGIKGVNVGHSTNYWNSSSSKQIGKECFAEMYNGITVNPESYKNLKRCFPKTAEIFEEIIETYGQGYAKQMQGKDE